MLVETVATNRAVHLRSCRLFPIEIGHKYIDFRFYLSFIPLNKTIVLSVTTNPASNNYFANEYKIKIINKKKFILINKYK